MYLRTNILDGGVPIEKAMENNKYCICDEALASPVDSRRVSIRSNKLNENYEFLFRGGYILVSINGDAPRHICKGGNIGGEIVKIDEKVQTFEQVARSWYKKRVKTHELFKCGRPYVISTVKPSW